jgi:DtxR family Mn-dependent transcriptional regulator
MDEMLGRPASDPHGDPIPTVHLEFLPGSEQRPLAECPVGATRTVARIVDQRAEFLRLLETHGLRPGRRIAIAARDPLADTLEIRIEQGDTLRLSFRAASRILVETPPGS